MTTADAGNSVSAVFVVNMHKKMCCVCVKTPKKSVVLAIMWLWCYNL